VAALYAAVAEQTSMAARLLAVQGGERVLTDLRHVSEIVHRHALEAELGLAGLVGWLRRQVEKADDSQQERSRRLDTERAAVHIVTVHTSKGLEYPVVMVPFAWDKSGGGSAERYPRGHDADDRRTLHLGGKNDSGYGAACAGEDVETDAEGLRLLYVAMTRAVSRLVLWWVPSTKTKSGALPRLLLAPDPAAVPATLSIPGDDALLERLRDLGGPCVAVQPLDVVTVGPDATSSPSDAELVLLPFDRTLDLSWRRTSYTALVRDAHVPRVGSEPPTPVKDDEVEVEAGPADGDPVPMGDLPSGPAFGTLVHEVLEEADLAVEGDLERVLAERDALELLPGLSTAAGTPLLGDVALQDVPRQDQLRELDFELPLAGGDQVQGKVVLSRLGDLLREHLPPGDCVRPYADRLPSLDVVRGYLGGSIDVVLRVDGRYYVVDHKTNRLARRDVQLMTWHYRREALDEAMLAADYPLQALLYTVALHRYLRWRQPDYDPTQHLGGVLYLFLRGMVGVPGSGVWQWSPPPALVIAVSELLAGRP
jgi:exodeoxyribonuclease V beta subunit